MKPLRKADRPSPDRFNQSELSSFLWNSGRDCKRPSHQPREFSPQELAMLERLEAKELMKHMLAECLTQQP